MELQEAINHAREISLKGCTECHKDHGQLADWLEELEKLHGVLGDEYDLEYLREILDACKGLDPEEIEESKLFIATSKDREKLRRMAEIVEADRDGRCVVLPCKVGDVLYSAFPLCGVNKHQVRKFERNSEGDFICSALMIPLSDFGKRVFLTREDAEKALKGELDG